MYQIAQSIYYSLAIFVLGTAFFVMQPSTQPEFIGWQNNIKHQLVVASRQTMGDQPWFSDLEFVYEGINGFYEQASQAAIALLTQPETDEDMIFVFRSMYVSMAKAFSAPADSAAVAEALPAVPPANFMQEEPIYNIVPYRTVVKTLESVSGAVAGASVENTPVNSPKQPWVTIQDNSTGQLYCIALYNDTVNKYLGPCKYDDYQ